MRYDPEQRKEGKAMTTKKAEEANLLTYIVTGDKDMMQLVSDKTFMYSPGNSFKPKIIYDREKVISKWGVGPEGIVEMLSLVGDTSDNIPGIDGVGPKTAKKLLEKYKNIDTILKNAESAGNKRVVEGLKKGKDLIHLSKELATIDCNVPIDFHIEEFLRKTMETEKLQESFKELEMFSLLSQIDNFSDVIPSLLSKFVSFSFPGLLAVSNTSP